MPLPRDGGRERRGEVQRVLFGQHGHGGCAREQARGGVPQSFPAQALPGHGDGGPVGAVIGPALESVEKRHQTNFTGREPPESRDAIL